MLVLQAVPVVLHPILLVLQPICLPFLPTITFFTCPPSVISPPSLLNTYISIITFFIPLFTPPSLLGLTISEGNIILKNFGKVGMDLNSVRFPGFRRLKFPQNSFGIPV
jgi:hypothetical protein